MICDAHNDILCKTRDALELKSYFKVAKENNVKKVLCAYYSKNNDKNVSINNIKYCFNLIQSITDIAIPTIENSWFLTPKNIDSFIALKPFCCTLTHSCANLLCGDAFEDNGFTNWGKEVVKILEENNILIDTAHMGKKSFFEFSKFTTKPIFNSHCAFDFVYKHQRNLSDSQIKLIEESGGYIGLAFYPKFFNKKINSKSICNTILKFYEKFDYKILGLGTDFNGINDYPEDIKDYKDMPKLAKLLKENGVENFIIDGFLYKNLLNRLESYN